MTLLADYLLDVDGEIFGTSPPEQGDVTSSLDGHPVTSVPQLSLGVSALDIPRLRSLQRKAGWLAEQNGSKGIWLRIDRVDPELKILVGTALSERPAPLDLAIPALDGQVTERPSERQA